MPDNSVVLDQVRRSLAITKKDLRVYYAKGPVVIFGILLPTFLFFSFLHRQADVGKFTHPWPAGNGRILHSDRRFASGFSMGDPGEDA